MILAVDVQYNNSRAFVSAITFQDWKASSPDAVYETVLYNIAEYVPGQFYKRELPCILKLLDEYSLSPDIIVVDGHVFLDSLQKPGLGKYLYDALDGKTGIIGVAKRRFAGTEECSEVYRGESGNPLFVTAAGIDLEEAKQYIKDMAGENRIPVLLKLVDRLCREKAKSFSDD